MREAAAAENQLGAKNMGFVVNDTALADTLTEARGIARSQRAWIGLLGAGLVLGLAGPFGTYEALTLAPRLGYWLVVVTTTFWLGYLTSYLCAELAERRGLGPAVALLIGALAAAGPVTLWLAALHGVIFDAAFRGEVAKLLPYVAAISAIISALSEVLVARDLGAVARHAPTRKPAWLDQLPPALGHDLILLQAQDHYLRAETTRGETLIRATLEDAASALGAYGMRVHRSWWVSRSAITAYRYRGGAPVLELVTGAEIPVGRTYRRSVREALRSS